MQAKNKKGVFRYLWLLLLTLNVVAIAFLWLACLAWVIPPAKFTGFAYLGLGFAFILTFNVAFLLVWLILRKWRYAMFSFIALLICIKPILCLVPINFSKKEAPLDSIKILSYNVMAFSWFEEGNRTAQDNDILNYIEQSGADIVCLQEYLALSKKKNRDELSIRGKLKEYPYYSFVNLRDKRRGYLYGLACFSKYPILSTEQIQIESEDNGSVLYKIQVKDKVLAVVNNHLESNRLTTKDKELYVELLRDTNRQTLDDFAHNMRSRLGSAYAKRSPQADAISEKIKGLDSDGIVVCGDFNDTPISYTYHKIKGDLLTDSYVETGFGPGITYHENYFWFRIDFILHSKNMEAYQCTVDKIKYSDHYPIWTYLRFK